jgi:hypothetical protein
MDHEPELTCVRLCQGIDLAQIYRAKLEAVGIPVLLKYESAGPIYGITIDGLGQVRVLVPSEYAADAEALLTDLLDDEASPENESPTDDAATKDVG